jgi:hypothetical protein
MSQGNLAMPTTGTVSGLTFSQDVTTAFDAIVTCNSGSTAPINSQTGVPEEGQFWLDTTVTATPTLKQYINGFWLKIAVLDGTNGLWSQPIGGGALNTLAAAATTDLGSNLCSVLNVTSTTGLSITSFGSSATTGTLYFITFNGSSPPILVQNSTSLNLPTGANIQTAAGDTACFKYAGSGNWKCMFYQLASGAPLSTAAVGAAQLVASSQGMNALLNLRINATVTGSQLVVSLATAANGTPSSVSPVLIPFRDPTIANGDPIIASLQSALSFSAATGNMLALPTTGNGRLWVCAYYNGGTLALGVFNASSPTQICPLVEGQVVTTAASTNGGNTVGTHYANVSSITNTPFRILGYIEWNTAVVSSGGTWATGNSPDNVTLFGPGVRKPGEVVQVVFVQTSSGVGTSGGTFITSNVSATITPTTKANLVSIVANGAMTDGAASNVILSAVLRRGASTNIGSGGTFGCSGIANGLVGFFSFCVLDAPASTSATTYAIYFNSSGAGATSINGGTIMVQELMG